MPSEERERFLADECRDDPALVPLVESLVVASQETGGFLEDAVRKAAEEVAVSSAGAASFVGRRLGAYRVIREVARGGMGAVYLAERADEQYRSRVALKTIGSSLAGGELVRRFRRERQILANLSHPNIAKLLDGGTTSEGIPYVVMEYIDGEPIDVYCERRDFGIEQRLELFRTVCDAVSYAHRNLVVHRDIKPGNIMVTRDGVVKLLDFGIARFLDPAEGSLDLTLTGDGVRLLTPTFASPEQVRGDPVTVSSDIYSLGAVLYQLLAGQSPHQFESTAPGEIYRVVCEETPKRLSEVAGKMARRLVGDLDSIVDRALRKEPERRYATVEQLSEDVRRYMSGFPVTARSDAWSYRARKFYRRHRAAVIAAAAFVLLLAGSALAMTIQTVRVARQRDAANRERERAERVSDFLVEVFSLSDPSEARGNSVTAREVLDSAAVRLDRELANEPEMRATLAHAIGRTYRSLGLYQQALTETEAVVAWRRRHEPDSPELVESLSLQGSLLEYLGRYEEAEAIHLESLELARSIYGRDRPEVAEYTQNLAMTYRTMGRLEDAEPLLREALSIRRQALEEDDPAIANSLMGLGLLLQDQGKYEEAEALMRECVERRRTLLGEDHPDYASAVSSLAFVVQDRGDLDGAEALFLEALELQREVLGNEHPDVGTTLFTLAGLYEAQARYDEAEAMYRDVLELDRRTLGTDHPYIALDLNNIAGIRRRMGDLDTAESLYRESLALNRRAHGPEHPEVATSMSNLGVLLKDRGRLDEAEPLLRDAAAMRERLLGSEHPHLAISLSLLGTLEEARGNLAAAVGLLERSSQIRRAALGPKHPDLARDLGRLAGLLAKNGQAERADELYSEALAIQRGALPADHPDLATTLCRLGDLRVSVGDAEGAEPLLVEAIEVNAAAFGPDDERTRKAKDALRQLRKARSGAGP